MPQAKNENKDKLRERIRQILLSQSHGRVTVLSSLLAVQDEIKYIPSEAVDEVAEHCDVTVNDVWSVADYYTNFRLEKPNGTIVKICWGPTCHIKGAQSILQTVKDEFNGTDKTPVTLEYNTCLGACSQAPVIALDEHNLVGNLDPQRAVDVIKRKIGLKKSS